MQLLRLRPAFEDFDVTFVSVYADYAESVPGHKFYRITDVSRFSIGKLCLVIPQLVSILLRVRPAVVLTTGSAPGLLGLALAKVCTRARTVWIDSIANCEQMSSSGKQARRFADLWLTQWPNLAGRAGPQHWGAVL